MSKQGASLVVEHPLRGIAYMILAMIVIPFLDVFAKQLTEYYSVMQVSWARFLFHLLFLMPLLIVSGQPWRKRPSNLGLQLFRGLMLLGSTAMFFYAIKYNPIPNSLALLFVSPLIVTLLSPLVLSEAFGWRRFIATVVGFMGVMIVLQPSSEQFKPSILLALLSGCCYASYILVTRRLSSDKTPLLTLFYTGLVGVLVLAPLMPFVWVQPDLEAWGLMATMGAVAALGHYLIILACQYAPASVVSPFNYFEIVTATLLSLWVYDYFPALHVWQGVAIIIASGIYISWREMQIGTD